MNRGIVASALVAGALSACTDSRPPAARVEGLCSGIKPGEPMAAVLARYEEYGLQPGGFAPRPAERLRGLIPDASISQLSGVLAEAAGSPASERPVCAIYYSDRQKGGDDRVVLAEFKAHWAHRY